jgi:hypothetical protein
MALPWRVVVLIEPPNDLGLSGGAGGTPGRTPRSTPTYPRPRALASGHVRSNPGLDRSHVHAKDFHDRH